ncbi:MAG TPA: hypothetical protein VKQ72_10590 [Aggregatilineales bacterium]|nr:hypothetical protein [Aggregatilineales bacterium]
MPDHTSNSVSFSANPHDKRPLPEIIASNYGFPLAYHDVDGLRYYAVQDWIIGVAQAAEPRKFWDSMKRRLRKAGVDLSSWCRQLPYRVSNGKTYKLDFADAEALYRITQRMDAQTGLREDVLKFLAKSGVVIDEIRIDPDKAIDAAIEAYKRQGKSDRWIQIRVESKIQRVKFTTAFRKSMRTSPQQWQYAVVTDEMRLGLWKRTTAVLKEQLELKKNDSLRDHQSDIAIAYELLTERISTFELDQKNDLEFDQAKGIVRANADSVGQHAEATGRRLGIDIATNRPLLKDENQ